MPARTIWIAADAAHARTPLRDPNNTPLEHPIGNTLRIRAAFFIGSSLETITDFTAITVEIKPKGAIASTTAIVQRELDSDDINEALTLQQWKARTASHIDVEFTDEEMNNFNLPGIGGPGDYLLCIWGIGTGGIVKTWVSQKIDIFQAGTGVDTTAPTPPDTYYTASQVDTMLDSYYTKSEVDDLVTSAGPFFNANDYGASTSAAGSANRIAIQAAIDACNAAGGGIVLIPDPGTYTLDVVNYIKDDGSTVFGIHSIKMKDNVHLKANGWHTRLKVADSSYGGGAYYRMISSRDATRLSNASVSDITLDGNRGAQTASLQCSNLDMECAADVTLYKVKSIDSNGQGMMLKGTTTSYATNLRISKCFVDNSSYIGIQSSQFSGLIIEGNDVFNSGDNGIDVYGEDSTTTAHGENYLITKNLCKGNTTGIFLETCRDGITSHNRCIDNTYTGIMINRINGAPTRQLITNNLITDSPTCLICSGDGDNTGGTGNIIRGNIFQGFTTAGIQFGVDGGNVSYCFATQNSFMPADETVPLVKTVGVQVAFIRVEDNSVFCNDFDGEFEDRTSASHVDYYVTDWKVLPVPYVLGAPEAAFFGGYAESVQLIDPEMRSGRQVNIGPSTYSIVLPTGVDYGAFFLSGSQSGVGRTCKMYTFAKNGTTIVLAAGPSAVQASDPLGTITANGSGGIDVVVTYANTYISWGFLNLIPIP